LLFRKNIFYILFFVILFASKLDAQTFNFSEISVEKGLSQSQVNCIFEDSRGFLWLGTAGGGLNQYDGNQFKVFEEKDGLAGNIVTSIAEDQSGNIWTGSTWGGVSIFDGKKFRILTKDDGLIENIPISICRGKNNQMFVAFKKGISIVEGKIISDFHTDVFANVTVKKMFRDNSGNVWILTDKKIYIYNGYSLVDLSQAFKIDFEITSIAQDKTGNIWLGTKAKGLFILSKQKGDDYILFPYEKNDQVSQLEIQNLLFDKNNNLWIGTFEFGVVKYDYKSLTYINKSNGFPSNSIISMCEDHTGNIWFGSNGNGLVKYFPCPFAYFDNIEGFQESNVFSILCSKSGAVWCATNGNGVYKLQNSLLKKYGEGQGLLSTNIRALAEDAKGRIWVGSKAGLNYIENDKMFSFDLPTTTKYIRTILFDSKGNMWLSVYGEGLLKYDGKNFKLYSEKDGLNMNYIHSLLEDKSGNIWIGTGNGINKLNNDKIINFELGGKLCNKYIGSITEDIYGNIWFGTDRCLIRFNGEEFNSFNVNNDLTSNTIYLLIADKKGRIYVGTNKGIDKITLNKSGDIQNIKNYGISEGFKGLECNSRSVSLDSSGNIFFGTIKGVIKYLPENDKDEEHRTALHITDVKLFPEENTDWSEYSDNLTSWFNLPKDLFLSHDKNNISFVFTGINLFHPEKVKYKTMLEGFDEDWMNNTTKTVTRTNLPPGNYTFIVKAYTDNESKASFAYFTFTIKSAFWKTWWFSILVLLVCGIGLYFIMKFRTHRIQILNQKLESLVELRTKEISKQKFEIETLYREVHHRVKNNLQVINSIINLQSSYITDEETLAVFKECQNRVYTMAILHEKLYSTNDLTANSIEPYVQKIVEYLAYMYKTDLDIDIDLKVEVNTIGLDTTIPIGLLINEIVSNSFKYAFDSRIKDRVITIHLKQVDAKNYTMIIGDNGKGFQKKDNGENISFGLELINILVEQLNGTIKMKVGQGAMYEINFQNIDKDLHKAP